MKITTWNVNGIRAAIRKGALDWVNSFKPDILCLQEIKARPDQLEPEQREISGYHSIWNSAQKPGYSGVATFHNDSLNEIQLGIQDPRFDSEGRVIKTRHEDFTLFNIYFPNGQRDQGRLSYKLDFYKQLLEICKQMHQRGEKIIITGDFNTAHNEIDLAHPRENQTTSGFLPEERAWISYYLENGFTDIFRKLYPEKVQYTWWTYLFRARDRNVGWRLDYFLISDQLVSTVKDVIIHDEVLGSDHCPVTLIL